MKIKKVFTSLLVTLSMFSTAWASENVPTGSREGIQSISITVVNDSVLHVQGHRPKIGLVLSGGGAKGSAHIGVLKVIEEVGIPIDYVAGTSMGSIIGGLYALGYSPDEMDTLISNIDWPRYMSDRTPYDQLSYQEKERKTKFVLDVPWDFGKTDSLSIIQSLPGGLVSGNHLENLFNSLALGYQGDIDFNDLPIPYACVATDLVSGQEVVFRKGNLPLAIRSSMSIPGLFAPVWWGDMVLVDGGILNNIPIDVCREMGADIVISVMVGTPVKGDQKKLHSILEVVGRLLGVVNGTKSSENIKHSDLTITPDLSGNGILSFDKESIRSLIDNGYAAADAQRDTLMMLKETLAQWGSEAIPHLNAPKAKNAITDSLKISSVIMHGVSRKEEAWLMWKCGLDEAIGQTITGEQLDNQLAILHGTNVFSKVSYSIVQDPNTNEYDVIVNFKKRPANTFGVALRFDNTEASSFHIKLGLNSHRIVGPKLELMAKLGYNPALNVIGSYGWKKLPKINLSYSLRKTESSILNLGKSFATTRLVKQNAKFYFSELYTRYWGLQMGLEFEQFIKGRVFAALPEYSMPTEGKGKPKLGLFGVFSFDNRDECVLPTKGVKFDVSGHFRFRDLKDPSIYKDTCDAMLRFKSYIPITKRLVLSPQVYARVVFGDGYYDIQEKGLTPDCYDMVYNNVVGGLVPGRFVDQQLPFIGFSQPELMDDYVAIGLLELRYNFYGIHHVSLVGSYMREASSFPNIFKPAKIENEEFGWMTANNYWGGGIRYTAKLPTGPAMLQVSYSSISKSADVYISLGLDF